MGGKKLNKRHRKSEFAYKFLLFLNSHLVSCCVLALAFFCHVKAQVLQKNNGTCGGIGAGALHLRTDAVFQEHNVSGRATTTTQKTQRSALFCSYNPFTNTHIHVTCVKFLLSQQGLEFCSHRLQGVLVRHGDAIRTAQMAHQHHRLGSVA